MTAKLDERSSEPGTLRLEVGKTYITRGGHAKWKVLEISTSGPYANQVVVLEISTGALSRRHLNGSLSEYNENICDLVKEWLLPEFQWMNLYVKYASVGTTYVAKKALFDSKKEADERAVTSVARLACIRIDRNTGEVKNEVI